MGDNMSAKDKLLDLMFPNGITCIFCSEDIFSDDEHETCPRCEVKLPRIEGDICKKCGIPIYSMASHCNRCISKAGRYKKARACFLYKEEVAVAIKNLKFENAKFLAKPLAKYLADLYKKEEFECDVIVPVPMHNDALKQRGYNQAELLAINLGKYLDIPVMLDNLQKIKNTKTQVTLDFKQRQDNLKDAFKVKDKSALCGKTVLVIDDVFTTGATIDNCTLALKKAKVKNVFALTIAHTIIE